MGCVGVVVVGHGRRIDSSSAEARRQRPFCEDNAAAAALRPPIHPTTTPITSLRFCFWWWWCRWACTRKDRRDKTRSLPPVLFFGVLSRRASEMKSALRASQTLPGLLYHRHRQAHRPFLTCTHHRSLIAWAQFSLACFLASVAHRSQQPTAPHLHHHQTEAAPASSTYLPCQSLSLNLSHVFCCMVLTLLVVTVVRCPSSSSS